MTGDARSGIFAPLRESGLRDAQQRAGLLVVATTALSRSRGRIDEVERCLRGQKSEVSRMLIGMRDRVDVPWAFDA